jgi:hypothetical protein
VNFCTAENISTYLHEIWYYHHHHLYSNKRIVFYTVRRILNFKSVFSVSWGPDNVLGLIVTWQRTGRSRLRSRGGGRRFFFTSCPVHFQAGPAAILAFSAMCAGALPRG